MAFYYVYVLKSIDKDFIYIGQTEDLRTRIIKHNKREVKSTRPYSPFELIYYEAFRNKKDVFKRERYLKSTKGKTTLKTMLASYFESLRKEL